MTRRWPVIGAIFVAVVVAATGVWALTRPSSTSSSATTTSAEGRALYQTHCASCHGARGEGEANWKTKKPDGFYPAPPHDSSGHTWHHADGLLFRIVREGGQIAGPPDFKSGMPAFGGTLSDAQIRATLQYIKTFWGPVERKSQADVSLRDPYP